MKLPHIKCAVCGRPVDRMDVTDDPWAGSARIRVHCHGASEVGEIDYRRYGPPWAIIDATAFRGAPLNPEMFR